VRTYSAMADGIIPTRSVGLEVTIFGSIATRSVSEGRSYVACDVFPLASLAHASGYDDPRKTIVSSGTDALNSRPAAGANDL
jgi:hypothetical protein